MYPENSSLSFFSLCTNFLGDITPVFFLLLLICEDVVAQQQTLDPIAYEQTLLHLQDCYLCKQLRQTCEQRLRGVLWQRVVVLQQPFSERTAEVKCLDD
jgi:hypothetical protein